METLNQNITRLSALILIAQGIEVDWSASLINSVCISTGEIVVSRLVVGAISDTVKKIKVFKRNSIGAFLICQYKNINFLAYP